MLIYKAILRLYNFIECFVDKILCLFLFTVNNVRFYNFETTGVPYIMVALGGEFSINRDFKMHNGIKGNPIGIYSRCTFFVDRGAKLEIGKNVGISQSALICHICIKIGNNVKIGGGAAIYDTDFHSLDPSIRNNAALDLKNKVKLPVVIGDNVFIGAQCIILKGVSIGENSIVGAGSVVTKSIPANEIWGGNPAKFIREIV